MLRDARGTHGALDGTLHYRLMKVVAPDLTGLWIDVATGRGKNPLPAEVFAP